MKRFILNSFTVIIFIIILLPVILFFTLQIKSVQNYVNKKVTIYIQENLNASVSIDQISYDAPFNIIISNVLVKDYQEDTLFYAKYIKFRPLYYNYNKNIINIDKIVVDGFRAKYKIDTLGKSNLDYFILNFPQSTDTNTSSSSLNLKIKKIQVTRSSIFYSNHQKDTLPFDFDIDTIDVFRFGFLIKDFNYENEAISFDLARFSAFEKSGFRIRGLSAKVYIDENEADLDKLIIRLNRSRFFIDQFSYVKDTVTNIENFNLVMKNQSFVNFIDLGFFSDSFKNYNEKINLGATISGPLNDLNLNNIFLKYKNNTIAKFSGKIAGILDPNNIYFDLEFDTLQTTKTEITSIKNPFDNKIIISLPDSIQLPEFISYKGLALGFINNFDISGQINSSSGNINFNFNILNDNNNFGLNGFFDVHEFDLGYLLKNRIFGKLSLDDSLDITYTQDKKIKGFNKTNLIEFEFNDYIYHNIYLTADFTEKTIKGNLKIADKNFNSEIGLDAIYDNEKISAKYSITVDTARLFPLNFMKDDQMAALSFSIDGHFDGTDISDLQGEINFDKPLILIKNLQKLEIKKFNIQSENIVKIQDGYYRIITIKSDFLNGNISGTINPESLSSFFANFIKYYFPSMAVDSVIDIFDEKDAIGNNFKIDLVVKNLKPILEIFAPSVFISDNTKISGLFNDANDQINLNLISDSIIISDNKINKLNFLFQASKENFDINIKIDSIGFYKFNMQQLMLSTSVKNDFGKLNLTWKNNSPKKNYGQISSLLSMSTDNVGNWMLSINIPKDSIYINDILWSIKSNRIIIDTTGIDIQNLTFSTKYLGQNIGLNGKISANPNDSLFLFLSQLDISQLNPILDNIKLNGFLLTHGVATNLLGKPNIILSNKIEKFAVNDVELGFVDQEFELKSVSGLLRTNFSLQKYGQVQKIINGKSELADTFYRSMNLLGKYSLKTGEYNASLIIDNFKLKTFAPYLKEYVSFSRNSNINGNLYVKGDKKNYDIQGFINLYGSFYIFPTGVNYTINGGLKLVLFKNLIKLEKTIITGPDLIGDATMWGTVKHNNFNDPFIDFFLKVDTIPVLDLPRTSSGKYYGKIVATGNIELKGYLQNLAVIADITAEPETKLTLLLDRPEEVTNKTNIVTFINPLDTVVLEDKDGKDIENTNIDLDLNLTLNPDAKFKIIFNEMTGEAIDIQGEGDVKVKKTVLGDIVIFGKIAIVDGSYKFILENIINRRFEINKGSSITFNGAPTDGIIDISTLYSIKNVNLFNLLQDENYTDTKTQADCYIYLTGPIMQPIIKFDVDLPKADKKIQAQVQNLDDANKNKQFLSLLLIGRFQPLPSLQNDFNANMLTGTFNAGELISNQLNSILTNLGTNVGLDVNYVTGNNTTTNQFDVALSVPLLNERVSITTDVGFVGNTQDNANTQVNNNFIGDFEVDVKLNKKGNIQLKAYNKSNRNDFYQQGYTQGIGLQLKSSADNIFKKDTTKTQNQKKGN